MCCSLAYPGDPGNILTFSENVVGLCNFFEPFLGPRLCVDVRVVLQRQLSVPVKVDLVLYLVTVQARGKSHTHTATYAFLMSVSLAFLVIPSTK